MANGQAQQTGREQNGKLAPKLVVEYRRQALLRQVRYKDGCCRLVRDLAVHLAVDCRFRRTRSTRVSAPDASGIRDRETGRRRGEFDIQRQQQGLQIGGVSFRIADRRVNIALDAIAKHKRRAPIADFVIDRSVDQGLVTEAGDGTGNLRILGEGG